MKSIVEYIIESISDENLAKLDDYIKSGKLSDKNFDKILSKIDTLNTKEKFIKDTFLYDYIKSKITDEKTVNTIFHYICKYNGKNNDLLEKFIKPIDEYHKNIRKRKNSVFDIYKDTDKFIDYIYNNLNEDIKIHLFNLEPDKYNDTTIHIHNIYDELESKGRNKELLTKLAKLNSNRIGKFEFLYKIFFYNIINPKEGDIGVINKDKSIDIIEFKAGKFALKSNGAKNKNAYKEFLEISDRKEWKNYINSIKNKLDSKKENFSPLEKKNNFILSNDIFKDLLDENINIKDELIQIYKNGYNKVFNARLEYDKNNYDFFELANINIEKLINNNQEEINKINKIMCICDLSNLIYNHRLLMIFDNENNGNYIFINFKDYDNDINELYNFISNNDKFYFILDPWWSIGSMEQSLVSKIELKIK